MQLPDRDELKEQYKYNKERIYKSLRRKAYDIINSELQKQLKGCKVTSRIKDFNSFYDKILRKFSEGRLYNNPFTDNEDFVGIRICYMYKDTFPKVRKFIYKNFNVKTEINKGDENRLGYPGIHFNVRLKEHVAEETLNMLGKHIFEIQTRTYLEDAWSNIEHDLKYKKKDKVPTQLADEIDDFMALIRISDNSFVRIRDEIDKHYDDIETDIKEKVDTKSEEKMLLNESKYMVNDIYKVYISRLLFPNKPIEAWPGQLNLFVNEIGNKIDLNQLKRIIYDNNKKLLFIEKEMQNDYLATKGKLVAAVPMLVWAYMLENPDFRSEYIPERWYKIVNKYRNI